MKILLPTRRKLFCNIFLAIATLLLMFHAGAQMRQVYLDSDSSNEVNRISFYSPSQGYVAFQNWIGFTSDSGHSFIKKFVTLNNVDYNGYPVNLTFGFSIKGVKAFDQNTILAYGDYGFVPSILYSNDGGNSFKLVFWSQFDPNQPTGGVSDMLFPQDDFVGYASDPDRILKTVDGGLTWSVVYVDPGSFLTNLEAPDYDHVFAFSSMSSLSYATNKLIKTNDGGANWQTVSLPPLQGIELTYAYFRTQSNGWLSVTDGNNKLYFYKTTTGAGSWVLQNDINVTPFACGKMKFFDDNTGYSLADQNTVFKTFDGGATWEPLPRDNNFSYRNYTHNDLFCWNINQLWAGGGHGFLELSANGGGTPFPKAFFKIDTAGLSITGTVNLINYSRPVYTYQWLLNGVLISNAYNAFYAHDINRTLDTITLIVSNGTHSDTAIKYQSFYLPVVVSSFIPTTGANGTIVTIHGSNFSGATSVSFGGVAASTFTVDSPTQITATVANGASGTVTVVTLEGSGSLAGFTYIPPLEINLHVHISDSILCQAQSINISIQNTEPNVRYDLIDSLANSYGFVNSPGGTVTFSTLPISLTGNYQILASRLNFPITTLFTDKIFIVVEHTKSIFTADRINIIPGEKVNFNAQSEEAQTFNWIFNQDANNTTSASPDPQNISYSSPGQKTLSLISTSANGCRDTLNSNAVFVYNKPVPDKVCFVQNIDDSDYSFYPSFSGPLSLATNNGFVICGGGNQPTLKSTVGASKQIPLNGVVYAAKYTTDGVLSWFVDIGNSGFIYAVDKDDSGNIYILGYCVVYGWFTFSNGNSIQVTTPQGDEALSHNQRVNGFILKLDSTGHYLWHTIFTDPTPDYQGVQPQGGLPTHLKIRGNEITIAGSFVANLAYYRNGVTQSLVSRVNTGDPNDNQNNFILRIKDDGTLLWYAYFLNSAVNQLRGISGIGVDKENNCYVSGIYEGGVIVNDAANTTFAYGGDVGTASSFLLKFDSSGRIVWKVNLVNNYEFREVKINALTNDDNGFTYVTGYATLFYNTESFQVINSDATQTNLSDGTFLLKFDPNGIYKWGVGSLSTFNGGGGVVYLKDKDLFICGSVPGEGGDSVNFVFSSTDHHSVNQKFYSSGFFLANYDTSGVIKRVTTSGTTIGNGAFVGVNKFVADNENNYLISGVAKNYSPGNYHSSLFGIPIVANGADAFFAKINPDYCLPVAYPVINAGPGKLQCPNDTATIGMADAGDRYYWTSNPASFSSTLPNPVVSPAVTTTYYLTASNDAGFISKDSVIINIIPGPSANAGPDQTICTGNSISIGTSAVAGNSYSWSSNPSGFSSSSANPTVSPSVNTDYYFSVTNNAGCMTKDTAVISVKTVIIPTVSILASDSNICSAASVTFSASAINGGLTPSFQWKLNGNNVADTTNLYTTSMLVNNDLVNVNMTSSFSCADPVTATSNSIAMRVIPILVPSIAIVGATLVTKGNSALMTAYITNGGNTPVFLWQDSTVFHSWQIIPGATGLTLNYSPQATGDKLRCILTNNDSCVRPSTVTSIPITFSVNTPTAINPVSLSNYGIRLFPNPANSTLWIDSLKLSDKWQSVQILSIDGKNILFTKNITGQTVIQLDIKDLPTGIYLLNLRKKSGEIACLKFEKL